MNLMPPYRRKLIEVALPLDAINAESAREKSIRHGHPSTLHLWWARRPLAACRAVLFSQLVDDPSEYMPDEKSADAERERLFALIEELVKWENINNEDVLDRARLEIARSVARDLGEPVPVGREAIREFLVTKAPPVLDPFAGGGSIPLEAQRLGLRAYASDLNPVAVLINKALIEIPPKFAGMPPVHPPEQDGEQLSLLKKEWKGAEGLAEDVRYYGKWMRDKAWERIGDLYPKINGKTVSVWLWTRTVRSPNPAIDVYVPLTKNFWLNNTKNEKIWIEPSLDKEGNELVYDVKHGNGHAPKPTMERNGGRCILSGAPITYDHIRSEGQAGRIKVQMMAIITSEGEGRTYHPPNNEQINAAKQAVPKWKPDQLVPTPSHDVDRLPMYGMYTWGDAFTPRQLVALTTFSELVKEGFEIIQQDALTLTLEMRNKAPKGE